jgi:hypothetical protein
MATIGGANIIRNGLVLELEAASRNSYPGSGTVWTDLSGNNNNGTLIASPTYSSNNAGIFSFNGTNQYATLGTPSTINNLTTPTVSAWAKFNAVNIAVANAITIYEKGYDGTYEGFCLRIVNPNLLQVSTYILSGNQTFGATAPIATVIGAWYNVVGQYTGTAWNLYINGDLSNSSITATGPQASTAPISIGAASISGTYQRFLNGDISLVQVYNRALSATEIQQNYNAQKSRFGL